jgi:hypothetical protein
MQSFSISLSISLAVKDYVWLYKYIGIKFLAIFSLEVYEILWRMEV